MRALRGARGSAAVSGTAAAIAAIAGGEQEFLSEKALAPEGVQEESLSAGVAHRWTVPAGRACDVRVEPLGADIAIGFAAAGGEPRICRRRLGAGGRRVCLLVGADDSPAPVDGWLVHRRGGRYRIGATCGPASPSAIWRARPARSARPWNSPARPATTPSRGKTRHPSAGSWAATATSTPRETHIRSALAAHRQMGHRRPLVNSMPNSNRQPLN